jgi:hypothetical protein
MKRVAPLSSESLESSAQKIYGCQNKALAITNLVFGQVKAKATPVQQRL